MSEKSIVPCNIEPHPESSRDPLSKMVEIAKDEELSDADKTILIGFAQKKFINRRRMAYSCLIAVISSLFLIFLAAFIDGTCECVQKNTCSGIMDVIKDNQSLIIWIEGFLTSIVAAYFGVSAWRPAS